VWRKSGAQIAEDAKKIKVLMTEEAGKNETIRKKIGNCC
jgi:hypothetical protein